MSENFEELDYRETPLGALILRRRRLLSLGGKEIFEVKLGDAFLMSSLFHAVEVALCNLALAELDPKKCDVVVGGLGLGYTAAAVLQHEKTRSLLVIEALPPVLEWHRDRIVPLGEELTSDPRCRLDQGDFFALARSGFDSEQSDRLFHAILLDIDHSPRDLLAPGHASFYCAEGLIALAAQLCAGGVFAMWSDDPPDEEFLRVLDCAFPTARAHEVTFPNPLLDSESTSTVYVAQKASA